MKNVMNVMKNSRKRTKTGHDLQNFVLQNCFGLMNHKNKFCKNFFLSLIGSTAFKLSDLLTTFLFFRILDNALMKAYSLYGHGGGKKSFKETKICGVIVTLKVLFVEPKNELSIFHFLFTLRIIKKKKLKTYWNLDNKFVFEMY